MQEIKDKFREGIQKTMAKKKDESKNKSKIINKPQTSNTDRRSSPYKN